EENQDDDDDDEQTDSDNDGDDFFHPRFSTHDDEARQEEVNKEDRFDPRRVKGVTHEEDDANKLYRDVNVNLEGRDTLMTDAPLPNVQATQETEDTHVILTAPINPEDVLITTIAEPPLVFATTLPPPPTPLITHVQQTPFPIPTTAPCTSLQDLLNFGSLFGFDYRLKTLETNFSDFKQMNQFAKAVSSIPGIALVEAYESDKLILDTYGDTVLFKRRRDDEDKDEEPFVGSNRGSKRRRARKEPESTSAPKEKTSKTTGKSTDGSKSQHKSVGESAHTEEPMHTDKDLEELAHQEFDIGATEEQSDEETSQHPN
ncbi:hypothetical protein Tco_0862221, partial [Tanacetum coccineum]